MRTRILLLVVALVALDLAAETVYLVGGKTVRGKVVKKDGKVLVTDGQGQVRRFDEIDVLYIADTSAPADKPSSGDELLNTDEPLLEPGQVDPALAPPSLKPAPRFTINAARRPEPVVFHLMRSAVSAPGSPSLSDADARLDRWQAAAKDRTRKVSDRWLSPEQITQLRVKVEAANREARDMYHDIRRRHGRRDDKDKRPPDFGAVYQHLREAASLWPDDRLRPILMGVSLLRIGDSRRAEGFFRRALENSENLAAGWQGLARAQLQQGQPLRALESLMELSRLKGQADETLALLVKAGRAVEGKDMERPEYLAAKEIIDAAGESLTQGDPRRRRTYRSDRESWLLPGRSESARQYELPLPAYDRIDFVQAIGVPTGSGTLAVDAAVIGKALGVFVRLDAQRVVPGQLGRTSGDEGGVDELSLVSVDVEGVTFDRLTTDPETAPVQDGEELMLVSLPAWPSLGNLPRLTPCKAKVDQEGKVSVAAGLLPGEGAGPVVTADGKLAGFMSGRLQVLNPGGGEAKFYDRARLADIVRGGAPLPARFRRRITDVPEQETEATVKGRYFIVYAVIGETMQDDDK
jgi:hypothetical protein